MSVEVLVTHDDNLTEEEIIERAFTELEYFEFKDTDNIRICEGEFHSKLTSGNIYYGHIDRISVERN